MYFHNSLIPSGAYFLLPLESKQEATSGWNFTKCILEVKVNQLKVKNMHVRMGISIFNVFIFCIEVNIYSAVHCMQTQISFTYIKSSKPYSNSITKLEYYMNIENKTNQ